MLIIFFHPVYGIKHALMLIRQMLQSCRDLSDLTLQFFDVFGMVTGFLTKIEDVSRKINELLSHGLSDLQQR